MRILGTALVALAVSVSGLTAAAATPEDDACRAEWADLSQLHGENGNPGGPSKPVNASWEEYAAQARANSTSATASECGAVIDAFADAWGALESFQYDLYAFDPKGDLRAAERDRRHYVELNGPLPRKVRAAFVVVRKHTKPAAKDLRPAVRLAPDVDFTDEADVRAFLRVARKAKRDSVHVQRMRPAYRVIGNAELDEE